VADWERCRAVSGCADVMIGRGAVSDPFLALRIRGLMDPTPSSEEWPAVLGQLADYLRKLQVRVASRHEHGRVKMWLSYLKRTWPQAAELHAAIRRLHDPREILDVIERALAFNEFIPAHHDAALGLLDPATPRRLAGWTVASAVQ
jgi:tRNA-dihydrouridine synthase C